jgi:hypothetical protein
MMLSIPSDLLQLVDALARGTDGSLSATVRLVYASNAA